MTRPAVKDSAHSKRPLSNKEVSVLPPVTEKDREQARAAVTVWYDGHPLDPLETPLAEAIAAARLDGCQRGLDAAWRECEKAFEEASTLNLLHGAARIRSLSPADVVKEEQRG